MTNIKFLLLGTSLSLIPSLTFAQCVATQDCETLGYTETSCNGGKGIKCPFGNKWACFKSDSECEQQFCDKYGFKYTCTGTGYAGGGGENCNGKYSYCNCTSPYTWSSGTGYSGGVGTACGGKYAACTCASGYEWKDGSCRKQTQNGAVGELYYCNGKVVGVRATGMGFYVAMKDLGYMTWSNANSQCRNYSFCGNVKGTLPTKDQLLTLYNKKSRVNSLLSTNGGTQLTNNYYWSSTLHGYYYIVSMSGGAVDYGRYDASTYFVRPVLTSY